MTAFTPDALPLIQQEEDIDVRVAEAGGMTLLWSRLRKGADLGPTLASAPSGNVCALYQLTQCFVVSVAVAPDDVAADHRVLLLV